MNKMRKLLLFLLLLIPLMSFGQDFIRLQLIDVDAFDNDTNFYYNFDYDR